MPELQEIIRDEIDDNGPMTFARFMELALYHPRHGYYTSGKVSIGVSGDFYTSPQMGPAFGRLVCEMYVKLKRRLGGGPCTFVEMGAGEGWLARDFIEALDGEHGPDAKECSYIIIERSEAMRLKQNKTLGELAGRVSWYGSLDELPGGITGVFFSNELVDALPFHRVRQDEDALKELLVAYREGSFREVPGPVSTPEIPRYFNRLGMRLAQGMTTEVRLEACRWIRQVADKLAKGFVVTVDYGYPACDYYHPERAYGTMMCYRDHRSGEDPFVCVGEQDITAHVDFSSVCHAGSDGGLMPVLFTDQSSFLMDAACGIEARLKDSGASPEEFENLGKGIKALVHPEWMGGAFKVLVQAKGAEPADAFKGVKDETGRLCECYERDSFRLS